MQKNAVASAVDGFLKSYTGHVPGASVAILRDGHCLYRRSTGFADLEAGRPAAANTNYRLASLTKQFTAAAVLLLAEERRLSIEDGARTWLPGLPAATSGVTIRHLLTHTSGLLDYEDLIPATTVQPLHDADVLRLLQDQHRTACAPGAAYRYNNGGYALLALIVARASGLGFAEFLHRRIFEPVGMHATVAHEEGRTRVAHRAYGYRWIDTGWSRSDQSATSAVLGDGGIYSSIEDLERWDAALYGERLLRAEWRERMFAPATPTDDPGVAYGFGWRITGDSVWHSGESIGFRNVIVRYPVPRLTVIILTNRDFPEPYPAALAIAAGVVQGPVP
ncbi:MAG: serine hydrolase domain-containing protein [Steroidobacteraceae bacterium]